MSNLSIEKILETFGDKFQFLTQQDGEYKVSLEFVLITPGASNLQRIVKHGDTPYEALIKAYKAYQIAIQPQ